MYTKLSNLIKGFMGRPKKTYKSEIDRRVWQVIEDLINPVVIDWELTDSDHKVIASYVEIFVREQEVDVNKMVVSPDLYPKLHKFIVALQGDGPWQESMAAYDYLIEKWPVLAPIIEKV